MDRLYFAALRRPGWMLAGLAVLFCTSVMYWPHLRYDASSETLVVEGDEAFAAYLATAERFPGDTFVLITLTPRIGEPFEPSNLTRLAELQAEVGVIPGVTQTLSVLDIPLLNLPGRPNLRSADVDPATAKRFFLDQDLFVRQLVSDDGSATAIKVDLDTGASDAERAQSLASIRAARDRYAESADLRIGGVPLIADDMIRYVARDVRNFSVAAVLLMAAMLWLFFRRPRWVFLCLGNACFVVGLQVGLLGFLDTPVSVISANFISILGIVSISLVIHLIVRYRELLQLDEARSQFALVEATMRSKFAPCLYTALTTIVAFSSLLASGIPPVEDFGWMMSLGVALAFLSAFTLFPALMLILPKGQPSVTLGRPLKLTRNLERLCVRWPVQVGLITLLVAILSAFGLSRLSLDSHFSQYFRPSSDVRQGLEYIDQRFGGVLPLDVLVQFDPYEPLIADEEDDFFVDSAGGYPQSNWFTRQKVAAVETLAQTIRAMPEVGSVTSIADLASLGAGVLQTDHLDDVQLALLVSGLGDDGRKRMVRSYANPESGELRLSIRMHEAAAPASYKSVTNKIRKAAEDIPGIGAETLQITGMYVLFGESIRTLFVSQRDTIAFVLGGTFVMFLLLLRNPVFAVVGIAANTLAAAGVLAYMGFANVPLDMMTITIAAIVIGISVDDAIHYLNRYASERARGRAPVDAVIACHGSIGRAIYFTSVTVIIGFSVLVLSQFVPTAYFGVLTAVAMAAALFANLLVMPSLLLVYERIRGA